MLTINYDADSNNEYSKFGCLYIDYKSILSGIGRLGPMAGRMGRLVRNRFSSEVPRDP